MSIATKNGSVILKSGSVAEGCVCCGGWWCYTASDLVSITITKAPQQFDSAYDGGSPLVYSEWLSSYTNSVYGERRAWALAHYNANRGSAGRYREPSTRQKILVKDDTFSGGFTQYDGSATVMGLASLYGEFWRVGFTRQPLSQCLNRIHLRYCEFPLVVGNSYRSTQVSDADFLSGIYCVDNTTSFRYFQSWGVSGGPRQRPHTGGNYFVLQHRPAVFIDPINSFISRRNQTSFAEGERYVDVAPGVDATFTVSGTIDNYGDNTISVSTWDSPWPTNCVFPSEPNQTTQHEVASPSLSAKDGTWSATITIRVQ